ncbi:hypothetical protein HID58_026061 [Brassica napus]|uniref:DYW domain-containing protein n=1 Tax=Brassica napus TaxID=3708 RepID=A0ABQ8CMW6_BRANA|nr:hypothetical protein HID58_026061 [Brassica napus]
MKETEIIVFSIASVLLVKKLLEISLVQIRSKTETTNFTRATNKVGIIIRVSIQDGCTCTNIGLVFDSAAIDIVSNESRQDLAAQVGLGNVDKSVILDIGTSADTDAVSISCTISRSKSVFVIKERFTSQDASIPNGRSWSHMDITNERSAGSNESLLIDTRGFVKNIHKRAVPGYWKNKEGVSTHIERDEINNNGIINQSIKHQDEKKLEIKQGFEWERDISRIQNPTLYNAFPITILFFFFVNEMKSEKGFFAGTRPRERERLPRSLVFCLNSGVHDPSHSHTHQRLSLSSFNETTTAKKKSLSHSFTPSFYTHPLSLSLPHMSLTLTPSSLALEQTLSCLHKCSKEVELKQVHAHMLKSGFFHDPYAITKFLSFCLSSTFSSYAQDVFLNGLDRPDTFLWNLMIKGLSSSDQPESSLLLYHRMLSSSAPHNPYTFPFLLKACSNLSAFQETTQIHAHLTKLGYANDVYSVNSLINSYAVTGRFNHARLLFDRIQEPDLVSWNSVIKGYAKAGEMDTALTLFRTIPQEKKNAISWTTIISGYVQAGMNKEALQLFHEMQNSNVPPDKVSLASALSACAQLGALEQGRWIHSYADKARISIDSKTGVKPNAITLTAVLTACSYTGLVEEGKSVFYTMERDYNVKPTIEHYGCMVDLLGRAGLLDEANRLVQKIPMKANAVIWGSLLKACQIHKNIELGERIGEILIGMDPNHGGRYVHTANIHATGGKWDKAAETRRLMKEKGVVKVPGCSTISLEGTTHEFVAGDGSHAEIEIIRSKWRTVRRRLEENGYVPELEDLLLDLADDEEREAIVHQHSEKLAVAYGLMKTKPGTTIRVMKNLRVCKDCHKVMKLVSEIYKRDIVMRDRTRFHRFRDGKCTCGDYW